MGLIRKKHFLAYERVEILVTFSKEQKSLLGKVHFQLNSFRVGSDEVFGGGVGEDRKFLLYYKQSMWKCT